uniref:Uncharacterized protein n=1 Tax=Psilocybe cubensis TaxID=181762 RepID=A0A8H7Y5T7_PSICU
MSAGSNASPPFEHPVQPDSVELFIDTLSLQFGLTPERHNDLHLLYSLGAEQQIPLDCASALTGIFALACQFSVEQKILTAFASVNGSLGGLDLKGTFEELQIRLQKTWEITKNQKEDLRHLSQQHIYMPKCTCFKLLHVDVEAEVSKDASKYSMQNIFGKPAHELCWRSEAKRVASSVRNAFRQDIRDSLFGRKRCSLKRFTQACADKYHHGTLLGSQEVEYQIRNVLLRRFAYENKELLGKEESFQDDTEDNDSHAVMGNKRQKGLKTVGRIPNGDDFWAQADDWFEKGFELRGQSFTTDAWKEYIDESRSLDDEWHKNNGRSRQQITDSSSTSDQFPEFTQRSVHNRSSSPDFTTQTLPLNLTSSSLPTQSSTFLEQSSSRHTHSSMARTSIVQQYLYNNCGPDYQVRGNCSSGSSGV